MIYFMLTNIMDQSTELICKGKDADKAVEEAFPSVNVQGGSAILPGVVSRKKQLIPALLLAIGEM